VDVALEQTNNGLLLQGTTMQLVIRNKNYSSWSMRPWVLLKQFGIVIVDFERESLLERLNTVGLKDDRAAFFTWLGVDEGWTSTLVEWVTACR
jgi:hypothetical protein